MKRSFTLILLLFLLIPLQAEEIKLSTISDQPIFKVCNAVMREVYGRLGYEISITEMSSNRAIKESKEGRMDGEVGRVYNYDEIVPQMIRVPTPYYENATTAFVRKDSGITSITPEDLKDYSVARISGVVNTDRLTSNTEDVHDFMTVEDMIKFVEIGRADLALTTRIGGQIAIRELNAEDVIGLTPPVVNRELYHFVHKSNAHLVPLIDQILQDLIATGELDEIISDAEEKILSGNEP